MSFPLPTQLVTQFEGSNTIFKNGTNLDNIFLQNHGLFPNMAQLNYSPDAPESFGFLSNLLQMNQIPATLPDQYPLQHETSLLLQNPPQFPYNMSQQMTNSFIPMEQNAEEMSIFGSGEASNNESRSVKRKPRNISKKQTQAEETRSESITLFILLNEVYNISFCI